MRSDGIKRAAEYFAQARRDGMRFGELPADCRPVDIDAGYAVQDTLHAILAAPVGGYKIGCTTAVMQTFLGIAQPCAGAIVESEIHTSPATLRHDAYRRVGVECEIAVRLSSDLPPSGAPYDRQSVGAAIATCMAAIEIVDDRYVDYKALDAPTLIADDFFGAGCVLGAPCIGWRELDLAAISGSMTVNDAEVGRGTGAHVMGHPFEALAWLANALARRGRGLAAGDIVLTGSIVETQWVAAGNRVAVSIEGLGDTEVSFA
jgi:2-oxo-3-hexenedioate decarboxylase/2-keto-4-pentenoate hydratase